MKQDVIEFIMNTVADAGSVKLISHNDADGVTSGAIMWRALTKLGVDVEWYAMPYMTSTGIRKVLDTKKPIVFIDMGSAYGEWVGKYKKTPVAVIDHHPIRGDISSVDAYWIPVSEGETTESIKYATAATLAQAIAVELGADDEITAWLAVIGATGDMADLQGDFDKNSLIKKLIDKAIDDGYIEEDFGLRLPGKFALDAYEIIDFSVLPPTLDRYDHLKGVDPSKLTKEDLESIYGKYINMVWGKRYINPNMPTELKENHDAAIALMNVTNPAYEVIKYFKRTDIDFSFINQSGKILKEKYVALKAVINEILRGGAYIETEKLTVVYNHTPKLVSNSTIANYIANKNIIGSPTKPVIVYSKDPNNGKYIASARIHYEYQNTIDLGKLMEEATKNIPGATGGGHVVAAGATIPEKYINDFVSYLLSL